MVQRYTPDILGTNENSGYADCVLSPRGEYVTHADYATLLAAHKKLCEAVVKSKAAEDYHASQEAYDWLVTAADLAAIELEQDDAN